MSNDALIRDLAANLAPVKRRSVAREVLVLAALAAAELMLFLGLGAMRPDMPMMIGSAYMVWRIGSLAILAGVSATVAVRSFTPPASPRRGVMFALALAALAVVAGMFVGSHADHTRSLLERISPANGMLCAVSIIVLSLPMMLAFSVLMRRAAPAHPEASALASGLAAGTCGAAIFAFCCPMNDPLYIVVWYCAGCAVVTATARWLLPRHFRL